jgi:hypothetical protein
VRGFGFSFSFIGNDNEVGHRKREPPCIVEGGDAANPERVILPRFWGSAPRLATWVSETDTSAGDIPINRFGRRQVVAASSASGQPRADEHGRPSAICALMATRSVTFSAN